MTVSDALNHAWELVRSEDIRAKGYYYRRIGIKSALPVYAGISHPDGCCRFSLMADSELLRGVSLRDETRGYTIDVEVSPAGHPGSSFIHVSAVGSSFGELFRIFAVDIVEQWISHDQPRSAIESVHRRFQHWRRFFLRGVCLSREEYIGLYAELTFLELLLDGGVDPDCAVNAWQGPLDKNQDFLFGSAAIEVKCSTSNDADTVRIANKRQLDLVGLVCLFLCHISVDFRENSGRTLGQLVLALRARLQAASQPALSLLEDRMLSAGYTPHVQCAYDLYGFTERSRTIYWVRGDFPRLVESALPTGIADVSYMLNLSFCSTYQAGVETIIRAVGGGVCNG